MNARHCRALFSWLLKDKACANFLYAMCIFFNFVTPEGLIKIYTDLAPRSKLNTRLSSETLVKSFVFILFKIVQMKIAIFWNLSISNYITFVPPEISEIMPFRSAVTHWLIMASSANSQFFRNSFLIMSTVSSFNISFSMSST